MIIDNLNDFKDKKEPTTKFATYRIDIPTLVEFRDLCKKNKISQTDVIKRSMLIAISEMKRLDDAK